MRRPFSIGIRGSALRITLFLLMSTGSVAHGQQLTVSLETNKGCGAAAQFIPGELTTFRYSVSKNAFVTLSLLYPDGSVSLLLVNQPVTAGLTRTLEGRIGTLLGTRQLRITAFAGAETAQAECSYTARAGLPPPGPVPPPSGPLTLSLTIDRGCGAQYRSGDNLTATYSASAAVNLTMFVQHADGTQSIIFTGRPAVPGQIYRVTGNVGPVRGNSLLILRPSLLFPPGQATCTYTVVP